MRWILTTLLATIACFAQAERIRIVNVQVWNGTSDTLSEPTSVQIEDDRIVGLGGEPVEGERIIDGGGRVLMPGLIDSHVHMTHTFIRGDVNTFEAMTWDEIAAGAVAAAREMLMNGFTTVRDMGGMGTGIKRRIDEGLIPGPRIYAAGAYISQTSGHGDLRIRSAPNAQITGTPYSNLERLGVYRLADGVPAILTAVRENFAEGAAYIKIHAGGGVSSEKDPLHTVQYSPEELAAANQAIRDWDSYWTVHAYYSPSVNRALDAGAACIDHGQLIDARTMQRIAKNDIFLSSNLTGMSEALFKHPVYGNPMLPLHQKARQFQNDARDFVSLVNKHKPLWVLGSDVVFSSRAYYRQHIDHEKHIAGEWFGRLYALKGMTSRAGALAQLTGRNNPYPGKLGVIEPGAYADLLIVDGNPLEDLRAIGAHPGWFEAPPRSEDLAPLRLIMKGGEVFKDTL